MRRRKLYKTLAVAFSAILLATSSPINLRKVSAKTQTAVKKTLKSVLEDPTEDGEYTLTFSAKVEGSDEESMIGSFFDQKVKLTVKDGKMWITVLNTKSADMLIDFTLGDGENYKLAEKTEVGEQNSSGTYNMYEYKVEITKPSQISKAGILAAPMGGQVSDKGNFEKYTKADFKFESIEKGFKGFDATKEDEKPTGKEALNEALRDYGMDQDNDGVVTPAEVNAYKGDKLDLTGYNLTDISLLKYLPENVTELNLSDNNISEIPADLFEELTGLENFYIERNKLTKLPKGLFKNCKNLNWISFTGNKIEILEDGDFEGLDNLTILDFEKNKIRKIETNALAGMPKLEQLSFVGNGLETIPDGALKPLAGSLTHLYIDENNISVLPKAISDCESLVELVAGYNDLRDINQVDFSKLSNLEEVDFRHNQIAQIAEGTFVKNEKLQGLDLFDNQLTTLSPEVLAKSANLRKLDVKLNNIRVVDKKLIAKSQSFNKFYPQKSAMKLTLDSNGNWTEQLSILDVMFWYDMTNSAKVTEIKSVEEYQDYLKSKGYTDRNFIDVLNDDWSYDWNIVTKLQKKDANGNFVTISETTNSDKADEMKGSVKFDGEGTYRIAKDLYTGTSGLKNFLFEAVSNEITVKNGTTAAPASTQTKLSTEQKKTTKVTKPSRVTKLKLKKKSKRVVKVSWKKQKNVSGYEVYRSTKKNKSFKKIKTLKKVGKVTYTNKKLKKGKTYYYKVRAYKVVSGKKVYGKFSTVKKIKIKK